MLSASGSFGARVAALERWKRSSEGSAIRLCNKVLHGLPAKVRIGAPCSILKSVANKRQRLDRSLPFLFRPCEPIQKIRLPIEAAASMGNRIFWIGSHGRNKNGKERSNRCRLFATDFKIEQGAPILTFAGKPCKTLLQSLIADPSLDRFHLSKAATLAPKEPEALNIEGLAAAPEGHLLIGFRNPIPEGKALLVPLLNPNEVIEGKAPQFDAPILLDLGGLGASNC